MASTPTLQRISALAIVGLLVLVAQPAAVLDAPAPAASQAPETDEAGCPLVEGLADEAPVEEPSLDTELVVDAPDAEVCLEGDATLGDLELEETLGEAGLD